MQTFEHTYAHLISDILQNGVIKNGRNGKTISIFGAQLIVNELKDYKFPLLQGRKMFYKSVLGELAAFFKGPTTVKDFEDEGCNYWSKWANAAGELTLDYGNAWIGNASGVNQIENVIHSIKTDPNGRRHLITGWIPHRVSSLSLPCCHHTYQWRVAEGYLDMIWIQRSVDTMVGLPSDIILAAAWNIIMAELTGYEPGRLIFQLGDTHIYEEHIFQVFEYLRQFNKVHMESSPDYVINTLWTRYDQFSNKDIVINDYDPMPPINFLLKE